MSAGDTQRAAGNRFNLLSRCYVEVQANTAEQRIAS
jgi:hypothetical protein